MSRRSERTSNPASAPAGTPLIPGQTIGILGGGQLGRMTALAARRMGFKTVVLEPGDDCPGAQVSDAHLSAAYDDLEAARQLAHDVDVVTLEFENMPASVVAFLASHIPTRPHAEALMVTQDRILEKEFVSRLGLEVAPFAAVDSAEALAQAVRQVGVPALLKTRRQGYDGKGQRLITTAEQALEAWHELLGQPCILEGFVPFERELSVVVARDCEGRMVAYEPAENVHVRGILDSSMVPPLLPEGIRTAIQRVAERIAAALDFVGVMAVELFLTGEGGLLVNELAPRPHNSGHWSIEACVTSQFEQQVRVVVGAPVGPSTLLSPAATVNLLGDLWADGEPRWEQVLAMPDVKLHLYGKREARPGRKMGHLTVLAPTAALARARALDARERLRPVPARETST